MKRLPLIIYTLISIFVPTRIIDFLGWSSEVLIADWIFGFLILSFVLILVLVVIDRLVNLAK